jgi:alpha-N-acetylglucosaminidase
MELMLQAPPSLRRQKQFRYDLVDVTRQVLSDLFIPIREKFANAYYSEQGFDVVQRYGKLLLNLIASMENVLATHENFLLGNWIQSARANSEDPEIQSIFEFNARNQVTLWGPNGQITDYASKQWAGLVGTYYQARWELFVQIVLKSYKTGTSFSQEEFNQLVLETVEKPWQHSKHSFPVIPKGDSFEVCTEVFRKYVRPKAIDETH